MILPVGFGSSAGGTPANAISRSLRFNSVDTPTLTRTPTSTGSRRIYTHSAWFKRTGLSSAGFNVLWASESSGTNYVGFVYYQDKFYWNFYNGTTSYVVETTQVFRDVSAWAHIVVAVDTTQATAANRVRIYYNGVQITVFNTSTYPPQDQDLPINTSSFVHKIGFSLGFSQYLNGYMTEVNFLDGYPTVGGTPYNATTWAALNVSTLFGETDTNTGVWKPKVYAGSYGTNGFYVNFSDNSNNTAATLGKDYSGNGNNLTPSGFSVTAGVGNDSLVDSPTSYGTDTGVGGEVRGNYCTMNPLQYSSTYVTLNNGNLNVTGSSGVDAGGAFGTAKVNSGKWYWEATIVAASGTYPFIGFAVNTTGTQYQGGARVNTSGTLAIASPESFITLNGSPSGTSFTTNDVLQFALDMDNGKMWIGKNGTWMNSGVPASGTGNVFSISDRTQFVSPFIFSYNSSQVAYNFGQRPFEKWNGSAYVANTAPSGFKALCTQNLPPVAIGATSTTQANDYMNVVLYTGNGTTTGNTQAITGVGFQPDFVWLKSRSNGTYYHLLNDAVRGANKVIYSNNDLAETTVTNVFNSFDSDGFTVAYNTSYSNVRSNENTVTYVGWNWKANGAGSTNSNGTAKSSSVTVDSSTDTVTWNSHGMSDGQKIGFFASVMPGGLSAGTLYFVRDAATNTFKVAATSGGAAIDITSNGTTVTCHTTLTSTVSANTTSEFSIITYTGSGSNATIEHGLDIAPTLVIVKERLNADSWLVWQSSISAANYLVLNSTAGSTAGSTIWNSTAPTSKVFSVGTNTAINQSSQTYVAYCFAPVDGYSAFGSYTGNNTNDNAFVYLGFRPEFIMIKCSSTGGTNYDWLMFDVARMPYNYIANTDLRANLTAAQGGTARNPALDILSNGFKVRGSGGEIGQAQTYIYAAFAENPFKYSLAR